MGQLNSDPNHAPYLSGVYNANIVMVTGLKLPKPPGEHRVPQARSVQTYQIALSDPSTIAQTSMRLIPSPRSLVFRAQPVDAPRLHGVV